MEFQSTQKLRKYAFNPEVMADKHPNVADLIEELQQAINHLEDRVAALEEPEA